MFSVTGVTDHISPAVDTSNPAVAGLPQEAKVSVEFRSNIIIIIEI